MRASDYAPVVDESNEWIRSFWDNNCQGNHNGFSSVLQEIGKLQLVGLEHLSYPLSSLYCHADYGNGVNWGMAERVIGRDV